MATRNLDTPTKTTGVERARLEQAVRDDRTGNQPGSVAYYFSPHRGWHDHVREVVQKIETPELIQMNDRTRIAHDMQSRLNRLQ